MVYVLSNPLVSFHSLTLELLQAGELLLLPPAGVRLTPLAPLTFVALGEMLSSNGSATRKHIALIALYAHAKEICPSCSRDV